MGHGLTPEVVATFAASFGGYLRSHGSNRTVIVGRDSRVSGPMFARAVTAALESVGCEVVDVGVVPTPTVQLAVEDAGAAGGVAITASHNPVEWNALKFIGPSGTFLDRKETEQMQGFLEHAPPRAGWDELGGRREDTGALDRHLERVLAIGYLDLEEIRARGLTVALDCVRGAGGDIFSRLLEELGCQVRGINLEPDGRFPREPEPVPENLAELAALVKETGADVGLAVDPDADRLALVDESGEPLGEDYTLALAAKLVLRHRQGPVVTNLSTSRLLDDVAEEAGVPLVRVPVGEINVARRMQEEDAVVGGEGNGGVILPDVHLGRDAPVAARLILQLMAASGRPLSEIASGVGSYQIVKEKVALPAVPLDDVYLALEAALAAPEADRQDGLRLDWPEERRWVHLRPSGTEPVVRVIAEAPTGGEARELVNRVRGLLPE